jgi:hypothetical protein
MENKNGYLPTFNSKEAISNVSNTIGNVTNNISSTASNTLNSVKDTVSTFSSTSYVNAGKEYLQSNSLIAKFVFIILVLIVFVVLFNLGIYLITLITQTNRKTLLINGMINGNQYTRITQDPNNADSIPIYRSNNRPTGAEFSWSVWLNVLDPGKSGKYSHIFNMGNADYDTEGIATVNNAPGLYLKNENNFGILRIVMDTIKNTNNTNNTSNSQTLDINNIPLNKWFHVLLRLQNNVLDVYIGGVMTARMNLADVPRLNYNDIYVCNNGGFNGNLSNLQYIDYAMNVFEINRIVSSGPNMKAAGSKKGSSSSSQNYYLSNAWYNSNLKP